MTTLWAVGHPSPELGKGSKLRRACEAPVPQGGIFKATCSDESGPGHVDVAHHTRWLGMGRGVRMS